MHYNCPGFLLQLTWHPGSIVTSVILFSQTNVDNLMLTFPNIFTWGIKSNNQSLHTCEKQAYISNRFCSRVTETKSVTIAPCLPYRADFDTKNVIRRAVTWAFWICQTIRLWPKGRLGEKREISGRYFYWSLSPCVHVFRPILMEESVWALKVQIFSI